MDGSTCMAYFISAERGIVLGSLTEDREVASTNDLAPQPSSSKKAPTPTAPASGSTTSSPRTKNSVS